VNALPYAIDTALPVPRPRWDERETVEGRLGYRGLYLKGGRVLSALSGFDAELQHRRARTESRPDYVFNFIFLPR
jgi:hypothetical protein